MYSVVIVSFLYTKVPVFFRSRVLGSKQRHTEVIGVEKGFTVHKLVCIHLGVRTGICFSRVG